MSIPHWLSVLPQAVLITAFTLSGCDWEPSGKVNKHPAGGATHQEVGTASWYGPGFQGRETANGETFNQHGMTAAHPTLPMGTKAKVTNLENGKKVEVRINDRGPYADDRVIDLSRGAAKKLGMKEDGTADVRIETKSMK